MSDWLWIILFFVVGIVLLILELFLPANGIIGLVGLGVIIYGLYMTYMVSAIAGLIGLIILMILLPTGLWFAVRYWHRTPLGRRISPPNPDLTPKDRMPVVGYDHLVGQVGLSITPLRPVGICEFDGRRIECLSEHGMIERNVKVIGVRLVDRSLSVRPVSETV